MAGTADFAGKLQSVLVPGAWRLLLTLSFTYCFTRVFPPPNALLPAVFGLVPKRLIQVGSCGRALDEFQGTMS